MTACYSHVTYMCQIESTLYSCLNVKELLAWNKCDNWSLSDSNRIQTHNHLVHKQTLNHLAKLAKRLNCLVNTYLYSAFDFMLLSCHIHVSEWIYTCLYSCLSVKEFIARNGNRHDIWSLGDSGRIWSHNHLVC